MAQVRAEVKTWVRRLQRLSVVFAADIRINIITELFLREMSPKQFHEEFGGGSISRVDRHFKTLEKQGWLRFIRSETGGDRRGATEHFYRATELAVFDNETWPRVPYSMRVAISWRTFKILAERVRDALDAGTLDAREDSHLTWTTFRLDQRGWERVLDAIDALFESIFEEQCDAKLRIFHSEERPMVATVALVAFESPVPPAETCEQQGAPDLVPVDKESPVPFPLRVSKVFADELCVKIVAEANLREISAPQFHREYGGDSIKAIRRRFKKLEGDGWLRMVGRKTGGRRRGAHEHFYRATGPAIFNNESWADVPESVKPGYSWTIFKLLADLVKEALFAGTFEARLDSHLSWSVLRLDQQGWVNVAAAVDSLFALIQVEKVRAEEHTEATDEGVITTTVGLAAFESPSQAAKEP
ncbi:MAG: hypothetical protein WA687_14790 [Solirubrobacterales bacterium]